jgi:hypothetical protein
LVSRAYFRDNSAEGSWCPAEKQRTSEYDAIYWWLTQRAVELTSSQQRPCTVMEAAAKVQTDMDISGNKKKGKMSIYQFMQFCCKERKAHFVQLRADRAAAQAATDAAAAAAAAPGSEGDSEVVDAAAAAGS